MNRFSKLLVSLVLVLILTVLMIACGGKDEDENPNDTTAQSNSWTSESTEATETVVTYPYPETVGGDTLAFEDLTGESADTTSESQSETKALGVSVGGTVVPDDGESFGAIMTGTRK